MGVRSQRPWPLPRPALTPLGAPQSQTCRGARLCKGPWGWRGGDLRSRRAYSPWPTQNSLLQPPLSLSPSPRPSSEGQTDQGGGPSSSGLVGPSGVKVIPTPTPDSSGPLPAPALRLATDTPGKTQGRWSCGPPVTAGVLSAPCPQTHLPLVPQPRVPDLCGTKGLGARCPRAASLLPSRPDLGANPLPPARPALLPFTGEDPQRSLDSHLRPLPSGPSSQMEWTQHRTTTDHPGLLGHSRQAWTPSHTAGMP